MNDKYTTNLKSQFDLTLLGNDPVTTTNIGASLKQEQDAAMLRALFGGNNEQLLRQVTDKMLRPTSIGNGIDIKNKVNSYRYATKSVNNVYCEGELLQAAKKRAMNFKTYDLRDIVVSQKVLTDEGSTAHTIIIDRLAHKVRVTDHSVIVRGGIFGMSGATIDEYANNKTVKGEYEYALPIRCSSNPTKHVTIRGTMCTKKLMFSGELVTAATRGNLSIKLLSKNTGITRLGNEAAVLNSVTRLLLLGSQGVSLLTRLVRGMLLYFAVLEDVVTVDKAYMSLAESKLEDIPTRVGDPNSYIYSPFECDESHLITYCMTRSQATYATAGSRVRLNSIPDEAPHTVVLCNGYSECGLTTLHDPMFVLAVVEKYAELHACSNLLNTAQQIACMLLFHTELPLRLPTTHTKIDLAIRLASPMVTANRVNYYCDYNEVLKAGILEHLFLVSMVKDITGHMLQTHDQRLRTTYTSLSGGEYSMSRLRTYDWYTMNTFGSTIGHWHIVDPLRHFRLEKKSDVKYATISFLPCFDLSTAEIGLTGSFTDYTISSVLQGKLQPKDNINKIHQDWLATLYSSIATGAKRRRLQSRPGLGPGVATDSVVMQELYRRLQKGIVYNVPIPVEESKMIPKVAVLGEAPVVGEMSDDFIDDDYHDGGDSDHLEITEKRSKLDATTMHVIEKMTELMSEGYYGEAMDELDGLLYTYSNTEPEARPVQMSTLTTMMEDMAVKKREVDELKALKEQAKEARRIADDLKRRRAEEEKRRKEEEERLVREAKEEEKREKAMKKKREKAKRRKLWKHTYSLEPLAEMLRATADPSLQVDTLIDDMSNGTRVALYERYSDAQVREAVGHFFELDPQSPSLFHQAMFMVTGLVQHCLEAYYLDRNSRVRLSDKCSHMNFTESYGRVLPDTSAINIKLNDIFDHYDVSYHGHCTVCDQLRMALYDIADYVLLTKDETHMPFIQGRTSTFSCVWVYAVCNGIVKGPTYPRFNKAAPWITMDDDIQANMVKPAMHMLGMEDWEPSLSEGIEALVDFFEARNEIKDLTDCCL
jgi:hypothetical protein